MNAMLRSWAAQLGGIVSGVNVLCPGPGHSPRDRSLSVMPSIASPDGFIVHSHAVDDWRECHKYVCARLGIPAFAPQRSPQAAAPKLNAGAICSRGDLAPASPGARPRSQPKH